MEGKLEVVGSHATGKNCIHGADEEDWQEEMGEK